MQKTPIYLITIGTTLLITDLIIGWIILPNQIKLKIEDLTQLKNGTQSWIKWSNITTPIHLSFHIFNTTNPSEVKQGAKPILEQFGPYTFTEKRVKKELKLNEDNTTVSYRQPILYHFRPNLSNGTLDDLFTVLNGILVILTTLAAGQSELAQNILKDTILAQHPEEDLFVTKTLDQILFKGWHVPMLDTLEGVTGVKFLPNNRFGFWYPKNGSDDGLLEVRTGVGNSSQFGQVVSWNGQSNLKFWAGESCNKIKGTDGSIFPPFVTRDRIQLFSPDLCRSLVMIFSGEIDLNGMEGYRFETPTGLQIENCFCDHAHNQSCYKSGAFSLAPCRRGAPLVMSTPHFLDGDEMYGKMSIGLKPERALHSTYIDLEPMTGLMIRGRKRIQVNFQLKFNPFSEHFTNVQNILYPILWVEESFSMTEKTQNLVKNFLLRPIQIIFICKWSLIAFSFSLIGIGIFFKIIQTKNQVNGIVSN